MKPSMRMTCRINLMVSGLSLPIRSTLTGLLLITMLFIPAHYVMSPPTVQAIGGNPSLGLVISQVYGGAGCGTAGCSTFQNDFIELFNRSNTPISLNGMSVQYAAATGTAWQVTALPNVTLQPGQYFLIAESFGANGVNPLPTPDATGTIAMSATAAKVALVNCTTALTGACPSNVTGACSIIDFVGYGTTANCNETANAPAPSTTTADMRNGGGNVDTDNNSTDFTAAAPSPRNTSSSFGTPSAVKLTSFKAARYEDGQILLEWRTGLEVDNLGFNVYREVKGKRTRINSQMLAGSALMVGAGTHLKSGRSYVWGDNLPQGRDAQYWLEEIDLNGQSTWHGPAGIDLSRSRDRLPPPQSRAVLLSRLGADSSQANLQTPVRRTADATQAGAAEFAVQAEIASRPRIKLTVKQEGWYRVTAQELFAAGFDPATDPRLLQLFAEGREQAFAVRGEDDGRFDSSDSIEFYGLGLDTPSTNARTYWLVEGTQPGQRIKAAKKKGSRAASTGFTYTVERKDRLVYFSSLTNGETENFFGAVLARTPVDQSVMLRHIDRASNEDATLEVRLQGVTGIAHRVQVQFNGSNVGEVSFAALQQGVGKFAVPHSLIKEGENIVTLTSLSSESDVNLVDSILFTYRHAYTADDDVLRFTASKKQELTVDGFTNSAIRVMDVTNPDAPLEVRGRAESRGNGYAVTISGQKGDNRTLMAFAEPQVKRPVAIVADQPSNLKDKSQGADYVIITRRDFFSSVEPLKAHRQNQGLDVSVVDIENIYDEFNFGEKSAQSVKDFLSFAKANWSKAPRFVLIVGDATFDPKGYFGGGDSDIVPTKLIDTFLMEAASDDWLADFDADGLAEMRIGRLSARNSDEVSLMAGKIIGYDNAPRGNGVLLVSDSNDGIDFEDGSAQLRRIIPDGVNVEEIVRGRLDDALTKSEVLDRVNRGQRIVNYFGHGSVDLWRGGLLTSADVKGTMGGDSHTLFFAITCLNGYFQDPVLDSLAESLVKAEHGGAAAVWASSGLCEAGSQLSMNLELFRLIFSGDNQTGEALTLGEAILKAKSVIDDPDVRRTYILFGDPAMRLR